MLHLTAAANHIEHALALDPTDLNVLRDATVLLQGLGRLDQALGIEAAILQRDPVNLEVLNRLGYFQRMAGHYDDAIAALRTVLSLSPGRGNVHYQLSLALLLKGDAAAALAEREQERTESWRMIGLPIVYHGLGRKADSDQALAAMIAKNERDWSFNIAYIYAYRGEADKAFAWLDKAVEYQDPGLSDIAAESLFANIRSDPRWLPYLRKIGYAPEQLAKIEFKVTLPKEWQAEATAASSGARP